MTLLCPRLAAIPLLALASLGCAFDSELADRVAADVIVDSSTMGTSETDLGYHVALAHCRVAIDTLELTTDGEQHASLLGPAWDLLVPNAYAHPGHYAGGEVVGELPGRLVFDWRDAGARLGEATLLDAEYTGANFSFTRARLEDGLQADDPLVGHTIYIEGVATLDDEQWIFSVQLDQDEGRRVVGLPMALDLDPDRTDGVVLGLQLRIDDPFEATSLFDGIDFAMLDEDGDHVVQLAPDSDAYNRLKRATQTHAHYGIEVQ